MKLKPIILAVVLCASFTLDASAAMNVKKGSFTTATATGNQQVTAVGLGAAGKAIIFFGTWNQTAAGTGATIWNWWGFATSSTSRGAYWIYNGDNVATTDNARGSSTTKCIFQQDSVPNTRLDADFVSFDGTDGNFTINWGTAPAAAYIVHYIVIGGADLTNQVVTQLTLNANTGNQSYAHGLGATPDFGIFLTVNNTTGTATTNATLGIGWAVSTTKRGSISVNADNGVTMTAAMDWNEIIANDRAMICLTNAASTLDVEMDFVSWDSTNITFNQINAPTLNTLMLGLFLKGGQYDAGNFDKCTTANCTSSFTVAFAPRGLMFMATPEGSGANRTVVASAMETFGGASSSDGTQEGATSSAAQDAVLNTNADERTVTDKAISILTVGNPATVSYEADLTALGTTSSLNFTTGGTVAGMILWAAIGDAGAAPQSAPLDKRRKLEKYGISRVLTNLEPREYEAVR